MSSLTIKRRYGIRCFSKKCRCGKTFYIPFLFFFFKDKWYKRCSECGMVYCFRMIQHIVTDSVDPRCVDGNKIGFDNKIWRKG